jgi:hypothetical protein
MTAPASVCEHPVPVQERGTRELNFPPFSKHDFEQVRYRVELLIVGKLLGYPSIRRVSSVQSLIPTNPAHQASTLCKSKLKCTEV